MHNQHQSMHFFTEIPFSPFLNLRKSCMEEWHNSFYTNKGGNLPLLYGLDFVCSGKGKLTDEKGKKTIFGRGNVIITLKESWYCYDPLPETALKHIWFRFDGETVEKLFKSFDIKNTTIVKLNDIQKISNKFNEIYNLSKSGTMNASWDATGLLTSLLIEILLLSTEEKLLINTHNLLDRAIKNIKDQLREPTLDLKTFLHNEGIGYESFRKKFKKTTGQYPHAFWLENKINLAKTLLERSEKSIAEIADYTGYKNIYHFSSFFKRKTGIAPSKYRQMNY